MHVPVIDLAGRDVASQIDSACRDIGFFAVVGHDVARDVVNKGWYVATEFFDLPLDEKLGVRTEGVAYPYGYFPMDQESLGDGAPPDLNESFNLGPPEWSVAADGFVAHPRRWPNRPRSFQSAWLAYYDAMAELASRLMRWFAVGLELEAQFFESSIDRHTAALRALNYPAQPVPPQPGQIRAAPHTDYGTLTILRPGEATGGLEVRAAAGQWLTVPTVLDGFIVNIGDMMQMWTNDRWRSTVHRVVNPHADFAAVERRQSIAFFHQPNWDTVIECLPSCTDDDHPPLHPPTTAGEWLQSRVEATHGHD